MLEQTFSITGKLVKKEEPQHHAVASSDNVRTTQRFKLLQHCGNTHKRELPMLFSLACKHLAELNGFAAGDHIRVFFTLSTIETKTGGTYTFFNAFKIEPADAPAYFVEKTLRGGVQQR